MENLFGSLFEMMILLLAFAILFMGYPKKYYKVRKRGKLIFIFQKSNLTRKILNIIVGLLILYLISILK